MSNTKFTPGPWTLSEPNLQDADIYFDVVPNSKTDWRAITRVHNRANEDNQFSHDEARANAKLIAAAPDLFEVVKELYAWSTTSGVKGAIFPKLEAAFKKATE